MTGPAPGPVAGPTAAAGRRERTVDVLVIGAGPAGLTAAADLARAGAGRVEVLDRELQAGGIPRHCRHLGYGLRDLRRVLTGPQYARRLAAAAADAGASVRTGTTATGWADWPPTAQPGDPLVLEVTGPGGLERVEARAVVLATGARERSRAARWVPGTRPEGVYSTGRLQQAVYLHRQRIGARAVVVGAEHVSYSAVVTLRHAGVEVVAMVTDQPRAHSYPLFHAGALLRYGVRAVPEVRVTQVLGRRRVSGVEVTRADGVRAVIACDTVVFTGDWIPDHELARLGGLVGDPGTRGPSIDTAGRTSVPGVFAVGNLAHPVETADVCALDGRAVVPAVLARLDGATAPDADRDRGWAAGVDVRVRAPLRWVAPNRIHPAAGAPPRGVLLVWCDAPLDGARLRVVQADRVLHTQARGRTSAPNRPHRLDAGWLPTVDPDGGPVTVDALG